MGAPVMRFEIGCKNKPETTAFYEKAFGWTMTASDFTTDVDTGAGKGIGGAITALGHAPHHYVMVYVETPNVAAACETIEKLGGAVKIGPVDIPGGKGRFAWFADPEGNMLGVFEPPAA